MSVQNTGKLEINNSDFIGDSGHINDGDVKQPLLDSNDKQLSPISQSNTIIAFSNKQAIEHNQLGTINGCYVPCLLNIMGIILFERLGWGVGQIGVSGVFLVFLIAEIQSILTVLSLSAIVTNGNMRGGGSYYMISRTLGPEFGGSIGVLFYSAYCVGVAFYCTGFSEEFIATWLPDHVGSYWITVLVGSTINLVSFIVALAGARWFTKINVILFFFQFLAIMIALIACFFRGEVPLETQTICEDDIKSPWTWDGFTAIWIVTGYEGFQTTFGVLFPAATGIMEGANLSGDLKNPTYSIPVGTLAAVFTSIIVYFLLIVSFAGSFDSCVLRHNTTIMQDVSWGHWGTYLVVMGIIISATSSALGSLFGGSRVLQAIARDRLFPYTKLLGYGSSIGDEPRVAVVITWFIAQMLLFIGSINAIAPISTSFFCLSYCTVNLSCFFLEISGTPNFRPEFKFYTWHTCLVGFIMNMVVMFYVDYRFGIIALLIEILIFIYLAYRAPNNIVWGDVTQSIIFHQVRKYLLRLDSRKMHSKLWRPSVLLIADTNDLALIDFCNNLKKGGLYIIGTCLVGNFEDVNHRIQNIKEEWVNFVDNNGLKAFPQIACAPTLKMGYENLLLLSGLGAMQPNTVIMPMLRYRKKNKNILDNKFVDDSAKSFQVLTKLISTSPADMDITHYTTFINSIYNFNKNVVLTANFKGFPFELLVSKNIQDIYKDEGSNNDINNLNTSNDKLLMSFDDDDLKEIDTEVDRIKKSSFDQNPNLEITQSKTRTNYWTFKQRIVPNILQQYVDVWLFAEDYTFDVELNDEYDKDFPMLIMQLSHILLQNKLWDKKAKLRVFLFVNSSWNTTKSEHFHEIIKKLRLGIDSVNILNEPKSKKVEWTKFNDNNIKENRKSIKKYYTILNNTIQSLSSQTYFTFIKLPPFPNNLLNNDNLNKQLLVIYYECIYILLKELPPTALVKTGQKMPVISISI